MDRYRGNLQTAVDINRWFPLLSYDKVPQNVDRINAFENVKKYMGTCGTGMSGGQGKMTGNHSVTSSSPRQVCIGQTLNNKIFIN